MRIRAILGILASLSLAVGIQAIAQELTRPPRNPCPGLEALGYERKELSDISVSLRIDEDFVPPDCSTNLFHEDASGLGRNWMELQFAWEASELHSRPLYWEDAPLERYGQRAGPIVQPVLSGAHFFGTLPLLPYKMGLDRPLDRVYSLGYYRPGSPAPHIGRRLPFELDAAAMESSAWLALVLLLP